MFAFNWLVEWLNKSVPPSPSLLQQLPSDQVAISSPRQTLGEGGFTSVVLGRYHSQNVAIKLFTHVHNGTAEEVFNAEIACLADISNKSSLIIGFFGAVYENPKALVLQLCQGGDIAKAFKHRRDEISLQQALMWYKEMAMALRIVHAANWCHRDVKCSNFMLQDGHAVLADFGLARKTLPRSAGCRSVMVDNDGKYTPFGVDDQIEIQSQVVFQSRTAGTWFWMAPEQLEERGTIDSSVDTWSFGVAMFEMFPTYSLSANPPNSKRCTNAGCFYRIPKLEQQWEERYPDITELIKRCWVYEPIRRIDDDKLVERLSLLERSEGPNSPLP